MQAVGHHSRIDMSGAIRRFSALALFAATSRSALYLSRRNSDSGNARRANLLLCKQAEFGAWPFVKRWRLTRVATSPETPPQVRDKRSLLGTCLLQLT